MKFGHYSNEELGIKRNLTCAMFDSKGAGITPPKPEAKDVQCALDNAREYVRKELIGKNEDFHKIKASSYEDCARKIYTSYKGGKTYDWAGGTDVDEIIDGCIGDYFGWLVRDLAKQGVAQSVAQKLVDSEVDKFADAMRPYAQKMQKVILKSKAEFEKENSKKMSNDLDELSAELDDDMDNDIDDDMDNDIDDDMDNDIDDDMDNDIDDDMDNDIDDDMDNDIDDDMDNDIDDDMDNDIDDDMDNDIDDDMDNDIDDGISCAVDYKRNKKELYDEVLSTFLRMSGETSMAGLCKSCVSDGLEFGEYMDNVNDEVSYLVDGVVGTDTDNYPKRAVDAVASRYGLSVVEQKELGRKLYKDIETEMAKAVKGSSKLLSMIKDPAQTSNYKKLGGRSQRSFANELDEQKDVKCSRRRGRGRNMSNEIDEAKDVACSRKRSRKMCNELDKPEDVKCSRRRGRGRNMSNEIDEQKDVVCSRKRGRKMCNELDKPEDVKCSRRRGRGRNMSNEIDEAKDVECARVPESLRHKRPTKSASGKSASGKSASGKSKSGKRIRDIRKLPVPIPPKYTNIPLYD